jgi:DNA-binding response OmpR family regulator
MEPPRIMVVEDEADIAALIKHTLERNGSAHVEIVARGDLALKAVASTPPDLLILDLNLPGMDGAEVCRLVRGRPATAALPIIIVTARTGETERIAGLDLGADDYVTKPFSLRELAARVRAVLRRRQSQPSSTGMAIYRGDRLTVDFDAVAVTVDDEPVRLTRREFELLQFLIENRNRVLSRERLLQRVWGYRESIETRSVDVHVGRLRAKLGVAGCYIETLVGLGYRFADRATSRTARSKDE